MRIYNTTKIRGLEIMLQPPLDQHGNPMTRNRATPEGHALGKEMARLCDESEPRARLKFPELPPRCHTCAFREGPHVANGSPETLMTALKCVMEGVQFDCHERDREGQICSGYAMLLLAEDEFKPLTVPWDFIEGK